MQIQKNLFLFLFLLFFLNSCSKAPDSKTILNSFPQLSYVSESQNIHLSIYLDDSESMRGFVTNPQSTYCLETGNFIQRVLETTISSYDIFTISSLRQQQFSSRTIRDPSLYNAISTPLDQTLHHIVNQVKNDSTTEHISIIVSDLVLSNDRDITNFTKQLKELSKISPEFLLIGFQSIFQGKYFSEYPIKGTLQVQNQTRPFYFLINTRTKKTLQLVKEKLLSTQNANVFEASAPVLMIDSITYHYTNEWGKRRDLEFIKSSIKNLPSIFTFLRKKSDSKTLAFYIRTWQHSSNSVPITPIRFTKEVLVFDKKNKIIESENPNLNDIHIEVAKVKEDTTGLWYVGSFSHLPAVKEYWYVYRFRGYQNDVQVPSWIENWSTDDDSNIRDISRTLFLRRFCNVLISTISNQVPLCDIYVSLKEGR